MNEENNQAFRIDSMTTIKTEDGVVNLPNYRFSKSSAEEEKKKIEEARKHILETINN